MLKLSALLSLLRVHLDAHSQGNTPLPPEAAGTIASLLQSCVTSAKVLETHDCASATPAFDGPLPDNVVMLKLPTGTVAAHPSHPNEPA